MPYIHTYTHMFTYIGGDDDAGVYSDDGSSIGVYSDHGSSAGSYSDHGSGRPVSETEDLGAKNAGVVSHDVGRDLDNNNNNNNNNKRDAAGQDEGKKKGRGMHVGFTEGGDAELQSKSLSDGNSTQSVGVDADKRGDTQKETGQVHEDPMVGVVLELVDILVQDVAVRVGSLPLKDALQVLFNAL
jgi:hypothetical protein